MKIPLDVFVKRSWPLLAVGAVLVLLVSVILFWFAFTGAWRTTASTDVANPVSDGVTSTVMVPRALDGVLVPAGEANLLPYVVMIDNHPDARPSAGLAEANLVFEIPVEGGMTRYMVVFDATTTVDQIGPVRSARPYFVELANALGAVYAHVGGSPEALDLIKNASGFRNLDEMANGKSFWRSSKRYPPHNTYTRTDLLHDAATAKGWQPRTFLAWHFKDDDPLESATSTTRGRTNGPTFSTGIVDVAWTYNREQNSYARSLDGRPHIEADGARVTAKNVVVLLTDADVIDSEGRLKLRTTGKGSALLYSNGKKHSLTWRRSASGTFQFDAVDGSDALFARGTTWVEIVTSKSVFDKVSGA